MQALATANANAALPPAACRLEPVSLPTFELVSIRDWEVRREKI
jgi:hypothetical protein